MNEYGKEEKKVRQVTIIIIIIIIPKFGNKYEKEHVTVVFISL